jgi:hypothetical protein
MAKPAPRLSPEMIDEIIQGVHSGWLEEISVEYATLEDPFLRVTLKGQKYNASSRTWEAVRIVVGQFRHKPGCSLRKLKADYKALMALYKEARNVQGVAIQSAFLSSKRKVA